jgi:hypothetical protein
MQVTACLPMLLVSSEMLFFFGLCSLTGILQTREHNVSETGTSFHPRVSGETHTLFDLLDRAKLNHRIWCLPTHLRMDTDPVSEMLYPLDFRILDDGHIPKTR